MDKLVGTGRSGDFVLEMQGTAADKGFRNLSSKWYPQTQSFDETMEALQRHYDRRLDVKSKIAGMKPKVSDDGKFVLVAQGGPTDGAEYTLTDHALTQYLSRLDVQTTFRYLLDNITYPGKAQRVKVRRDAGDVATFVTVVQNGLRHFHDRNSEGGNEFLFRTYDDTKEIQAVLTNEYSPIDNRWYLNIINEMIPGGRYSHMARANDNTLFGNVIIPDSIREEDDSDYGGMLSLSNCEIGLRKLSQYPSVFRAICMNGHIWDQKSGVSYSKRHRGLNDLDAVKANIVANLTVQIPLAHDGIDKLLATRAEAFSANGVKMARIFVAVSDMFKFQPKHLIRTAFEYNHHEREHRNLFGVVASLTRAGQSFDNNEWVSMDAAGGALTNWQPERWDSLLKRAASYTDDEVADAYKADEKYLASLSA
jgi:hypothetical protein